MIGRNRAPSGQLERLLASLLHHGTLGATAVVAAGLALAFARGAVGMRVAAVGVALFILLPVVRVGVMLVFFLRMRDHRYSAIAALVLLIVSISFLVGAR